MEHVLGRLERAGEQGLHRIGEEFRARAPADAAVAACGLDPSRRLESLTPDELLALHAAITP